MTLASLRYYGSLIGDWSGTLVMRVTDPDALGRTDTMTRLMGLYARVDGRVTMATTLRRAADTELAFDHTTTVSRLGLTTLRSQERIVLAPDGLTGTIRGMHHVTLRPDEPYEGTISFGDDALTATYRFTWMHAPMEQHTRIVAEGLQLTQETAWSHHEVLLRRASSG